MSKLRVLSWNMAYWKPGGFRSVGIRRRQWALVLALNPDVALLQECRPADLVGLGPPWASEEYVTVSPRVVDAGSTVLARRALRPEPIEVMGEPETRWRDLIDHYLALASVVVGERRVLLARVHARAEAVDDPRVTDAHHETLRRSFGPRAWHADVVFGILDRCMRGGLRIAAGDWNESRLFDELDKPEWAQGGTEFFQRVRKLGWRESLRKFHPTEIRTYLDTSSRPYELDHMFTDPELDERLRSCRVVDGDLANDLSDHAPIMAKIDTTGCEPTNTPPSTTGGSSQLSEPNA